MLLTCRLQWRRRRHCQRLTPATLMASTSWFTAPSTLMGLPAAEPPPATGTPLPEGTTVSASARPAADVLSATSAAAGRGGQGRVRQRPRKGASFWTDCRM